MTTTMLVTEIEAKAGRCQECRLWRYLKHQTESEKLICSDCLQRFKNQKIVQVVAAAPTLPKAPKQNPKPRTKRADSQQVFAARCAKILEVVKESDRPINCKEIGKLAGIGRQVTTYIVINHLVEIGELVSCGKIRREFIDSERQDLLYSKGNTRLGQLLKILNCAETSLTIAEIAAQGVTQGAALWHLKRSVDIEKWRSPDGERRIYYALKTNQKAIQHLASVQANSTDERIVKILTNSPGLNGKQIIKALGKRTDYCNQWTYKLLKMMDERGQIKTKTKLGIVKVYYAT
jgi:hypothetical protein